MRAHTRVSQSALWLVCTLLACSNDAATDHGTVHLHADAAAATSADAATLDDDFVACPNGIPGVAASLSAKGKSLAVKVVSSEPAELERYINDWTVDLLTLDGSPAAGAQVVRAQTFMPLHGHDGGVTPRITALSEPGRSKVDRLNFIMRGPWEVRFWLRSGAGDEDYVVFQVCVAK